MSEGLPIIIDNSIYRHRRPIAGPAPHFMEPVMPDPTQRLRNEHEVILRALDILATAATIQNGPTAGQVAALGQLCEFFGEYADRRHHLKEEDILFPALAESGLPLDNGPIAVMLHEHNEGRGLVENLRRLLPELPGNPSAWTRFSSDARAFITLLRGHIYKENNVLFYMAAQILSPDDAARVEADFAARDAEIRAQDPVRDFVAILDTCAKAFQR